MIIIDLYIKNIRRRHFAYINAKHRLDKQQSRELATSAAHPDGEA